MNKFFAGFGLYLIVFILTQSAFAQQKGIPFPHVKVELEYHRETVYKQEVNTTKYKVDNITQLYDGTNELNIVEGYSYACYFITCTAPYPVKWVTNIPLKKLPEGVTCSGGQTWKYFNSLRSGESPFKSDLNVKTTEKKSPIYTIQLMFGLTESAGGLLKCLSIENSTRSTHYYFTDGPGYIGKEIVSYAPDYTDSDELQLGEIFWEKTSASSDKKLTVPCRANKLTTKQNLTISKYLDKNKWDEEKVTPESGLKLGIIYSPVIGFTFDKPDFQETRNADADIIGLNTGHGLLCIENDKSQMSYKLIVYSKERQTSKMTILENSSQLENNQDGCFLIRDQDKFIFRRNGSDFRWEIAQKWHPLKFMQCNTPDECDMLRKCLDFRGNACYSDRGQIQVGTRSAIWEGVSMEIPHNRGLLRCMDYKGKIGFKPIYEYTFIGLDKRRYVLSEDIPKSAVIFVAETAPTLYTNVKTTFQCQISSFVLVPNIKFGLVYTNGTIVLRSNRENNNLYDTNDISNVLSSNFNLGIGWQEISLDLTPEVVGIMCFAPLHNSSKWVNVSRSFIAKDVKKTQIDKSSGNVPKPFQRGDKDFSLHCAAKGTPSPQITWILPYENMKIGVSGINDGTIHLTEITNDYGDSFLRFPPMQPNFEGIFKCFARNQYGDDSHEFPIKFEESGIGSVGVVGIIIGIIALLAFAAGFFVLWRKYSYAKRLLRDLTEEEIDEFKNGKGKTAEDLNGSAVDLNLLPFKSEYVLQPGALMIEKNAVLGEGQFGIVHRGLLNGVAVAVKTTKSTADVTYVKAFLGELKVMAYIGDHPQIVQFLGAHISQIRERIVEAAVELCPLGNLLEHLKKIRSSKDMFVNWVKDDGIVSLRDSTNKITTLDLVKWCTQIASGMNHLATKRVYHGDLAARNVLVFNNNVVKITDFGLSKQLYASASYVKKQNIPLPWRWMALESLRFMEFSIESDVWSFAATVWEIFSLGETPYHGLAWTNEFVNILSSGMRMSKPLNCPKNVYDLMLKCWHPEKEERPNFADITKYLDNILKSSSVSQAPVKDLAGETVVDETPIVYTQLLYGVNSLC